MTHSSSKEIAKIASNNRSYCHGEQLFRRSKRGNSTQIIADNVQMTNQILFYNLIQFKKVLVVGLGQLGLPVAKYVKERGFDTYGYDISPKSVEMAQKTAAIEKAADFREFDVFILCVSTHKPDDMFSPQIDGLLSVVEKISIEAKCGALISIESTIPKGTSKKVFEMLNHRLHVVHAPHRWYAAEEKEHGVNQLRVIGGVCDCCLKAGMKVYDVRNNDITNTTTTTTANTNPVTSNSINGDNNYYDANKGNENKDTPKSLSIPMHPVSEVEIAETTKIVENAQRYLQIAFAEDLYLYCQANDLNFSELRDALNTKWNVNILEPREGIGGHCLPKDTKMFLESSNERKSKILTAAMDVNEDYKKFRAKLEKQIKSATISVKNTKS
jgi:UDP-N-acetyl-D-mannosaminuronic acid dehydrogenase